MEHNTLREACLHGTFENYILKYYLPSGGLRDVGRPKKINKCVSFTYIEFVIDH